MRRLQRGMKRRIGKLVLMATFAVTPLMAADQYSAIMSGRQAEIISKYCLDCHDSETMKGQVDLEDLSYDLGSDIQVAERWQEVLNVLNAGEMPPKKKAQLSVEEKTTLLAELSEKMVVARKIHGDSGGMITMRRLNQREYANTIESLLGVRPNVDGLPNDRAGSGFDTAGASLYFSSDQLEQYIEIAEDALRMATSIDPVVENPIIRVEAERGPFGRAAYQKRLDHYLDELSRARAYAAEPNRPPEDFGFKSMRQAKGASATATRMVPLMEAYLRRPDTRDGILVMSMTGRGMFKFRLPAITAYPQEQITLRIRAAAYPGFKERFQYIEFVAENRKAKSSRVLGWRKVRASFEDPEIIEFPVTPIAGEEIVYAIQKRSHPKGSKDDLALIRAAGKQFTPAAIWLDWVEIERSGHPVGTTPEAASIFFPQPAGWSDTHYAREVLQRFAIRAFRNAEPSTEYLEKLVGLFEANRQKGLGMREALLQPLSIVLASPSFLYMVESTGTEQLTDTELAIRLSYFLWSAPPDATLMRVAAEGRLSERSELKRQTIRLLADARADEFVKAFVHQWLGMDRLGMFTFDTLIYQEHDTAVLESSRSEIYETFRYMLDHKYPLGSLLQSDFVVVNDVMADYYGIAGCEGHEFRKVSLPAGSPRGGLLGTAAVLSMGSDGLRTSPVERGAWVLRHLLNDPPPPAPPNVPQLDRIEDIAQPARQLVRAHQEEPQCMQCHQKIDPIGFGMEHFDAAGLWRDREVIREGQKIIKDLEIDASGELANGVQFTGYFELRAAIAAQVDNFARGFTEEIIAYGLGRPFGFSDDQLAEDILASAKLSDYALDVFIHALVQSKAFQSK